MYYVYVFMQRRMQNSHVIITQLRELVVPPLALHCTAVLASRHIAHARITF